MTTPAQVLPNQVRTALPTRAGAELIFAPRGLLALHPEAYGQAYAKPPELTAESAIAQGEAVTGPVSVEGDLQKPLPPRLGVLCIRGPLLQHWGEQQSYAQILCCVSGLVACKVERIALMVDSPGGLVAGCFQTGRAIRALCDAAGIELYAFFEGTAASAAYALACVAHKIYCCDTAYIGSIGVIAALSESTKLDAELGLRYMIITSGERKADGNAHIEISESSIQATQSHVDSVADLFFNHVAAYRPKLQPPTLKALEAGTYLGAQALAFGFADVLCDEREFLAAISAAESPIQKENTMKTALQASKGFTAAVEALKGVADDKDSSDVEKEAAKKMLSSIVASEDAEDGDKEEKKEPAASSDDEDKEEKKEPEASATPAVPAAAAKDPGLEALAKLHTLEATIAQDHAKRALEARKTERKAKRATLLAGRPDITGALRAKLETSTLETVEHYCANLPKGSLTASTTVAASLAGSQVMPTVPGESPGGETYSPRLQAALSRNGIGAAAEKPAITVHDDGAGMQAQTFSVLGKPGKRATAGMPVAQDEQPKL